MDGPRRALISPRPPPRRRWLARAAGCAAAAALPLRVRAAVPRVVVVGAGWAGLAAVHALRAAAPTFDVCLIDRQPRWRSLPLSNAWLAGLGPERLAPIELAGLGARAGWRFVAGEVRAIDRERRRLLTEAGAFDYDALVLATGAEADYAAWFGADARAAAEARRRFPSAFGADELDPARAALAAFEGGTLVMTVPSPPLRCPPAPYERALFIVERWRARGTKARLVIVDAGAGMPRWNRVFAGPLAPWVEHRAYNLIASVDPFAQRLSASDGELRWDHALLLPPMCAGRLLRQAGLLARDAQGQVGRWAAVDPDTLRSPYDARIWLAGDMLDAVSPLFGAYPKTAQVAADLGAAAAAGVAAALRGEPLPKAALPRSECHVWTSVDPPEQKRLEAEYRRRGDGLIAQTLRQRDNPQPRDEDLAWLRGVMAGRLGMG